MILTLSTTYRPATDLGYLLHKSPGRLHRLELPFGAAHMLFTEAGEARATFALMVEVDAVGLVRSDRRRGQRLIDHYVNDRAYAASSLLSVAMARALRNAMAGTSKERAGLAGIALPLEASVEPIALGGGEDLARRLFEPLGLAVEVVMHPLDPELPDWGTGPFASLKVTGECRLADLLTQLYVLIPVLDRRKHYYVGGDELEKLIRRGEGWLAGHPEKELIARRYLKEKRALADEALERLKVEEAETALPDDEVSAEGEACLERPIRLHEVRLDRVAEVLAAHKVRRVVDLGCGEGRLVERLLKSRIIAEVLGIDVSIRALEAAERRLRIASMSERQRARVRLVQGSLTCRDKRMAGFDAATLVEVIEHLEPDRLPALERVVFEAARPGLVVVTTPNREYNIRFEGLKAGARRHADHRFEWTRGELASWAEGVCARRGYEVAIEGIGEVDPALGAPSQMAVFTLKQ
ncbi:MAG: 3' terminal RNA ribose 2'-O-methyltransferase Hen1 [Hyphomicrobiaceae bacterium]